MRRRVGATVEIVGSGTLLMRGALHLPRSVSPVSWVPSEQRRGGRFPFSHLSEQELCSMSAEKFHAFSSDLCIASVWGTAVVQEQSPLLSSGGCEEECSSASRSCGFDGRCCSGVSVVMLPGAVCLR